MVSKMLIIKNCSGLHARPASVFVKETSSHRCGVTIRKDEKEYNAKSILSILSACVKNGSEIELICDGVDEEEALASISAAVEGGLGE